MKRLLERSHRLLSSPIGAGPRALALAAALLVLPTYFFPLWNLTMFAPQYGGGLRLDIYSYRLQGGNGGQDLKEINLLNHYIGMRDLAEDDFTRVQVDAVRASGALGARSSCGRRWWGGCSTSSTLS